MISLFSDILLLSLNGSTNMELFVALEEELDEYRKKLNDNRWMFVMDLRYWELASPEYIEAMKKHSLTSQLKGRRCDDKIVIFSSKFTYSILLEHFKGSPANDDYVVNNLTEATEIAGNLGYLGSAELAEYWEKIEGTGN